MPEQDLFGNVIYSKEELKEIQRKEAEEKARKEAEEKAEAERIAAEKELKKKIKDTKKDISDKLNKLKEDPEAIDTPELMEQLETALTDVPNKTTLVDLDILWRPFEPKYNAMIAEEKKKENAAKEEEAEKKAKKYKYPFLMYFGHEYRDVTGVFEEGKEYTEKQLTKALVDHGYKDFKYAQEIQWEYFEDENCLFPKFKLGNRG